MNFFFPFFSFCNGPESFQIIFSPQESSSGSSWPFFLIGVMYFTYLFCINYLEDPQMPEELNTASQPVPALEVQVETPMSLPEVEPMFYLFGTKACSDLLILSIVGYGSMLIIYVVAHAVVIPFLGTIEQYFAEDAVSTTVKKLNTSSEPVVLEVKTRSLDLLNTVDTSTIITVTDIITK